MNKNENCGHCRAWLIQDADSGICSRHAPRPIIKVYGNADLRNETLDVPGIFSPITNASFSCAEYLSETTETPPAPATKKKN